MKKITRNYKTEATEKDADRMRLHVNGMELRQAEQTAFDALALAVNSGKAKKAITAALNVYGFYRNAVRSNAQLLDSVQSSYAVYSRSAVQQELEAKSGVLASVLKAYTERAEKKQTMRTDQIAAQMLVASKHLDERGKQWLQIRTAPKRKGKRGDIYPSQRDIAAAMGCSKTTVNELEQKLESIKAIRDLFALMPVPLRKPRGATGTKRKKHS